jgi:hypothetical protein
MQDGNSNSLRSTQRASRARQDLSVPWGGVLALAIILVCALV